MLQALQRERLLLQQFESQPTRWLTWLRQRRKVSRAQRALAWSKTRLAGEEAFIRRQTLRTGPEACAALLIASFVVEGFRSIDVLGAVVSLFLGAIVGWFWSAWEWDRSERELSETLDLINTSLDHERAEPH